MGVSHFLYPTRVFSPWCIYRIHHTFDILLFLRSKSLDRVSKAILDVTRGAYRTIPWGTPPNVSGSFPRYTLELKAAKAAKAAKAVKSNQSLSPEMSGMECDLVYAVVHITWPELAEIQVYHTSAIV